MKKMKYDEFQKRMTTLQYLIKRIYTLDLLLDKFPKKDFYKESDPRNKIKETRNETINAFYEEVSCFNRYGMEFSIPEKMRIRQENESQFISLRNDVLLRLFKNEKEIQKRICI